MPGLAADADVAALVAAVPVPVNILFLPGRHTLHRLAALGVRRVSTGSLLFRAAVHAAVATATAAGTPTPAEIPSYQEIQRLAPS